MGYADSWIRPATGRCESGWTGDRCQLPLFHLGPHDNEEHVDDDFDIEAAIYDHQGEWINREFGEDASQSANYGWGVTEHEDGTISVATKVYGYGVFTTTSSKVGEFDDEWEGFDMRHVDTARSAALMPDEDCPAPCPVCGVELIR